MKKSLLLVFAIVFVFKINPTHSYGSLYTSNNNKIYYIESEHQYTWFDGLIKCLNMNMSLVTIESSSKSNDINRLVKNTFNKNVILWIGGVLFGNSRQFHWISTGKRFTYTHWWANNPDFYGSNEYCAHIGWGGNNMEWNDHDCRGKFGFICEYNQQHEQEQELQTKLQQEVQKQQQLQQELTQKVQKEQQSEQENNKQKEDLQKQLKQEVQKQQELQDKLKVEELKQQQLQQESNQLKEELKNKLNLENKKQQQLQDELKKELQKQQELQQDLEKQQKLLENSKQELLLEQQKQQDKLVNQLQKPHECKGSDNKKYRDLIFYFNQDHNLKNSN